MQKTNAKRIRNSGRQERQPKQPRNSKRILSVSVRCMIDDSPDTSYLGEYGNRPESDYSIDRAHDLDCVLNTHANRAALDQLDRVIVYLNQQTYDSTLPDELAEAIQEAQNLIIEAQDGLQECTCGGRGRDSREYRYFNPCHENYAGCPEAEIRKYCLQDYERMESLNEQQWCYLGIRAEAVVKVTGDLTQRISSGGLWGIESDSDKSYFAEVEAEELAQLRNELHALGFSKRAVSAAFRNVEHRDAA